MSNRREFIATAAGAMLTGLGAAAPALSAPKSQVRSGGTPTGSVFVGLQGENLLLRSGASGDFAVNLVWVHTRPIKQRIDQFTLVLRGPAQLPLQAGMYELAHEAFGSTALRIDPSGQDELGLLYRSDFSLMM